jgi:hypothetical protein
LTQRLDRIDQSTVTGRDDRPIVCGSAGHRRAVVRVDGGMDTGRVEDWRASLGRCLCSPLSRPFVCECHIVVEPDWFGKFAGFTLLSEVFMLA